MSAGSLSFGSIAANLNWNETTPWSSSNLKRVKYRTSMVIWNQSERVVFKSKGFVGVLVGCILEGPLVGLLGVIWKDVHSGLLRGSLGGIHWDQFHGGGGSVEVPFWIVYGGSIGGLDWELNMYLLAVTQIQLQWCIWSFIQHLKHHKIMNFSLLYYYFSLCYIAEKLWLPEVK